MVFPWARKHVVIAERFFSINSGKEKKPSPEKFLFTQDQYLYLQRWSFCVKMFEKIS